MKTNETAELIREAIRELSKFSTVRGTGTGSEVKKFVFLDHERHVDALGKLEVALANVEGRRTFAGIPMNFFRPRGAK